MHDASVNNPVSWVPSAQLLYHFKNNANARAGSRRHQFDSEREINQPKRCGGNIV